MAYIPGFGHLSNPYIVFNDANGKPLSNGTVETYIAGTTTAYNTLKDWNGTYNGAIITLDIYGGCTIIAPETQGLKLIVKTSTGSLYKTFPNVFIGGQVDTYKGDVSDNQNTWYLDTVNGLDSNSGQSRSAPKKTGDAVVIACKTAGKTTDRLVVMAGSGTEVLAPITFTAANWSTVVFPFFDIVVESVMTRLVFISTMHSDFNLSNGIVEFDNCSLQRMVNINVQRLTLNGGVAVTTFDYPIILKASDRIVVNGVVAENVFFDTPILVVKALGLYGRNEFRCGDIEGSGTIFNHNNAAFTLDIQTNQFSFEGEFQFPSQTANSSIKITAAKMLRTATTRLLYLGAEAGVTVNYQLVVDTMGSIVPMEIANPAGTVAGKVIELLKYENKVDAEIVRATAAEALKANKLTTVNNSIATAYTFLASDANTCHIVNTSAATTRTVPSDTTAPDIAIGDSIEVQNLGTGVVTFVAASGVTIRSSLTLVMYGQYSVCMLRKIAANTWILTGERTAV